MLDIFTVLSLGVCEGGGGGGGGGKGDGMVSPIIVLLPGCIEQAHYPTWPGLPVFNYHYSSGAYPTRLEQLLKYQLGVWGNPKRVLWPTLPPPPPPPPPTTASVKMSSME